MSIYDLFEDFSYLLSINFYFHSRITNYSIDFHFTFESILTRARHDSPSLRIESNSTRLKFAKREKKKKKVLPIFFETKVRN